MQARLKLTFDSRNRDIANLRNDGRKNDTSHVVPEMVLVLQVAIRIHDEVFDQLLDILAQLNVQRVLGVRGEEGCDRVEDGILVSRVSTSLWVEKLLSLVLQSIGFSIGYRHRKEKRKI